MGENGFGLNSLSQANANLGRPTRLTGPVIGFPNPVSRVDFGSLVLALLIPEHCVISQKVLNHAKSMPTRTMFFSAAKFYRYDNDFLYNHNTKKRQ